MDQNRRRSLRKVPDDVAFIQIERDEVGKVLNISEGGLSFSSVTPVPRNLPVYFWFSFNLQEKIEAMGEVAWTDLSRTVGGLRFTQISQAGREQIKKWMSRLRTEEVPREAPKEIDAVEEIPEEEEAFARQLVAAGPPAPRGEGQKNTAVRAKASELGISESEDRVAKFVSKARAHRPIPILSSEGRAAVEKIAADAKPKLQSELPVASLSIALPSNAPPPNAPAPALGGELQRAGSYRSMFSMEIGSTKAEQPPDSKSSSLSFRGIDALVELVPLQRYLSAKKQQLLCGIILGVCLSVAVTIPVVKFTNNRAQADVKPPAVDSAGFKNNTSSQQPITTRAALPQTKPTYPVAGIFSDPLPIRKTSPSPASRSQLEDFNRYRVDPPKTVPAKTTETSTGASVQAPSGSTSAANKKSGMNPMQLWGEVQAGNSKAAVELAELYIKGDGVPRNCQQARVLLLVASEKRNTTAIKRLHDLDRGAACP